MADLKISKGRYTVDPLYQWDINQKLKIYGLSILNPEINFTNDSMGGSVVFKPTVDESGVITVDIPNSLLQFAYPIVVYVTGFEDKTFKTYHKVTIPVKARKRPGDYTLSLSDNEVYSFQAMNRRIADIEAEIESEGSILYSYTLDADDVKLVEASGKKSIGEYIPLVSSSLKAVKGLSDKFKTMIDANTKLGETALSLAKGINSAKVFDTTADMETWLSDENNKGKCQVGNNLYIIDVDVPDWWIAEVLDTPDSETGFYYKIAQLEVQKVDLSGITDVDNKIDNHSNTTIMSENGVHNLRYYNNVLEVQDDEGHWQVAYRYTEPVKNITVRNYVGNGELPISWEAPVEYDFKVASYNIYMCTKETTPTFYDFELVGNTTELSYTLTGIENLDNTYLLIASVSNYGDIQKDTTHIVDLSSIPILTYSETLEENSWENISIISQLGIASDLWSVGDEKTFDVNGETYTAQIIDFAHDDLADGSGKAGITFGTKELCSLATQMNTTNSNSGGWGSSYMRNTTMPLILSYMSEELQTAIKEVTKKYNSGYAVYTCTDKLFIFGCMEITGSAVHGVSGEGTQYAYFTGNSLLKKTISGSYGSWWTRTAVTSNSDWDYVYHSSYDGDSAQTGNCTYASAKYSTPFGFCI